MKILPQTAYGWFSLAVALYFCALVAYHLGEANKCRKAVQMEAPLAMSSDVVTMAYHLARALVWVVVFLAVAMWW